MWSAGANQSCHGGCGAAGQFIETGASPFTTNTQRYGTFVQMSYRFNARP
jgi:hypothetical protein